MNFDLSETQRLFQSTTERFASAVDVTKRHSIRSLNGGYARDRWQELAELGLLSIGASSALDGLDGSLTDLSIIAETLGLNNALDPWLENGAFPIRLGNVAADEALVSSLLDGSQLVSVAFAEKASRYELFPNNTHVTPLDDGSSYELNGDKHFVQTATLADRFLVTAQQAGQFGIYSVASDSKGIETQHYRLADGSQAAAITFNQVKISLDSRLNITFEQFQDVIAEINVLCCAEMLGLSQLLLNSTISYVKEREQFGVTIGSFQTIQHGLVDCYSELEQMRSLLFRTLLLDTKTGVQWHANAMGAKSFIGERADLIARTAVQFHGAMGITDEVAVGHAMKRIMLLSRLFGDTANNLKQYARNS
ncbi:MAG: acyl-CoA/acyl-ACP dehydrogenase [Porticoccaceae bacterium]|nr:acyl-CoA/acyl-ACP dehydrogenase [Porticoccaceae bacterium]